MKGVLTLNIDIIDTWIYIDYGFGSDEFTFTGFTGSQSPCNMSSDSE